MTSKTGLLVVFCSLLGGCSGMGGLGVEAKAVSTEKPGHVAAYLAVSENGEPALGLRADDFTVYENGQALGHDSTQQVLLDKSKAAAHHTLLLVDNSEATTADTKKEIELAIATFVERVQSSQSISVYSFDGSKRIRLLAEFARREKAGPVQLPKGWSLAPSDRSRNLNGALVLAEEELTRRLAQSGKALQVGTLVVFAGGADLAGRVDASEAVRVLRGSSHAVLGISFGEDAGMLRRAAKDGYFRAFSTPVMTLAFEDAGHRVRALYDREYLLSYCSPARSGERELRIEARVANEDGSEKTGGISSSFRADGFSSACDPKSAPRFQVAALR